MTADNQKSNALINSKSPYLLQHAYNPVNWVPYSHEAFREAKKLNKLVLVSIGYSSCHWCHVMEKESFEDRQVADLMNEYFVCIKVDREEHPDVDHFYMNAVQLMTGKGGWPLNCFALADGRPVYGGTYFPKPHWINLMKKLREIQLEEPRALEEYAAKLHNGLEKTEGFKMIRSQNPLSKDDFLQALKIWYEQVDLEEGGPNRVPKFALPANYLFLLRYAKLDRQKDWLLHVHHTLACLAKGGIFDALGGGFARYSTDRYWKVPHFEKMLYDNAQLIELFAEAWLDQPLHLYEQTIEKTIAWLFREMMHPEKIGFYAALDADSEGEEGKYYVWQEAEMKALLPENDWAIFAAYYSVNDFGYWEHGHYVLCQRANDDEIAAQFGLPVEALREKIAHCEALLLAAREQRVRPGLDDKLIFSWNAMTIGALVRAADILNRSQWHQKATTIWANLLNHCRKPDGRLFRIYKDEAYIDALLEDYAFGIEAAIKLFQSTAKVEYLHQALAWLRIAESDFQMEASPLFYFSAKDNQNTLVRPIETQDNVIPSSNAVMAWNYHQLGLITGHPAYLKQAETMLQYSVNEWKQYPQGAGRWGWLWLKQFFPTYECVIAGENARNHYLEALRQNKSQTEWFWTETPQDDISLFAQRFAEAQLHYFVCEGASCKLPVKQMDEALMLMS